MRQRRVWLGHLRLRIAATVGSNESMALSPITSAYVTFVCLPRRLKAEPLMMVVTSVHVVPLMTAMSSKPSSHVLQNS